MRGKQVGHAVAVKCQFEVGEIQFRRIAAQIRGVGQCRQARRASEVKVEVGREAIVVAAGLEPVECGVQGQVRECRHERRQVGQVEVAPFVESDGEFLLFERPAD